MSVNGVMQANGANNDKLDPGFIRGGWSRGKPDQQAAEYIASTWERADAFLLGQRTCGLFEGYWGGQADNSNPFAGVTNPRPKYVVSQTLSEPIWENTTDISENISGGVKNLKAHPGGELVVVGSGVLARWLLEKELVDKLDLIVFPVIVGDGVRLFPQQGKDFGLDLVETRAFPTGILAHTYRLTGRPDYA
ncbi:dihydrofolate reductase [Salinibacterium sp. CAN_S4]